MKAGEGTIVTECELKEHFHRVSCERYEVDPGVIEGGFERTNYYTVIVFGLSKLCSTHLT